MKMKLEGHIYDVPDNLVPILKKMQSKLKMNQIKLEAKRMHDIEENLYLRNQKA